MFAHFPLITIASIVFTNAVFAVGNIPSATIQADRLLHPTGTQSISLSVRADAGVDRVAFATHKVTDLNAFLSHNNSCGTALTQPSVQVASNGGPIPSAFQLIQGLDSESFERANKQQPIFTQFSLSRLANQGPGIYLIEGYPISNNDPHFKSCTPETCDHPVSALRSKNVKPSYATVIISDLALVGRVSDNKIYAWAHNLKASASGPITISLVDIESGRTIESETADATGLVTFKRPKIDKKAQSTYALVATQGQHTSLANLEQPTISRVPFMAIGYSDRSRYQPGQKISYRGIVKRLKRDGQIVEAEESEKSEKLELVLTKEDRTSGSQEVITSKEVKLSSVGTLNGAFDLAELGKKGTNALGKYRVEVRQIVKGKVRHSLGLFNFSVESYTPPPFHVDAKPTSASGSFPVGQPISFDVQASTTLGALSGGKVKWQVLKRVRDLHPVVPLYEHAEVQSRVLPPWIHPRLESVANGEVDLDADGKARIQVKQVGTDRNSAASVEYVLAYTVSDKAGNVNSGQVVASSVSTNTIIQIEKDPSAFYTVDKSTSLRLRTVTAEGEPIPTPIEVIVRTHNESGSIGEKQSFVTSSEKDKRGTFEVPLAFTKAGEVEIVVKVKAGEGSRNYDHVSYQAYVLPPNNSRSVALTPPDGAPATIVLENRRSATWVGDKLKFLLLSREPNARGVFTLEQGKIVHKESVQFVNGYALVTVDASKEHVHGMQAALAIFGASGVLRAEVPVPVSDRSDYLDVNVIPMAEGINREKDGSLVVPPGTDVRFGINIASTNRGPTPTETGIIVINEEVERLAPNGAGKVVDFFRDGVPSNIYGFTAEGYNQPETGRDGPVPLSMGFEIPGVQAMRAAPGVSPDLARTNFKDLAAWIPDVLTEGRSATTRPIKMPDGLRTFKVQAVTTGKGAQAGIGSATVKTYLPFAIEFNPPPTFVEGDEVEVAAVVSNHTSLPVKADAKLTVSGAQVIGESTRTIELAKDASQVVRFKIKVEASNSVHLTLTAKPTEGKGDAVELDRPVIARAVTEVTGEAWEFTNPTAINTVLSSAQGGDHADSIELSRKLRITVSNSVAAPAVSMLEQLTGENAGFEELAAAYLLAAKTSQTLATDLSSRLLIQIKELPGTTTDKKAWDSVETAANVVETLLALKTAGFDIQAVGQTVVSDALDYLQRLLDESGSGNADLKLPDYQVARILYLKSLQEPGTELTNLVSQAKGCVEKTAKCSTAELAYLLLGLTQFDDWKGSELAKSLRSAIVERASEKTSSTVVYWSGANEVEKDSLSAPFVTSVAIRALLRSYGSNNELISIKLTAQKAIRFLLGGVAPAGLTDFLSEFSAVSDYLSVCPDEANSNVDQTLVIEVDGKNYKEIKLTSGQLRSETIVIEGSLATKEIKLRRDALPTATPLQASVLKESSFRFGLSVSNPRPSGVEVSRRYFRLANSGGKPVNKEILGSALGTGKSLNAGEVVTVALKISSKDQFGSAQIEDFLPAGATFERLIVGAFGRIGQPDAVVSVEGSQERLVTSGQVNVKVGEGLVQFDKSTLNPGDMIVYQIRVGAAGGRLEVLPAQAQVVAFPEIRGRSENQIFKVERD